VIGDASPIANAHNIFSIQSEGVDCYVLVVERFDVAGCAAPIAHRYGAAGLFDRVAKVLPALV
jgi:hypothetical protein